MAGKKRTARRIVSGIQPSGELHLGNYVGAIKPWVELQEKCHCFFFIADYHAITVPYEPKEMNRRVFEVAVSLLAAGLDPSECVLFVQSHVPEHTELAWILNTITPVGELERMTQYKDKKALTKESPNVGLLTYPVLQAADVLLYEANFVPVGRDQQQHLELIHTIARKLNSRFGTTLPLPEALFPKTGAKIMSLQNPEKKMSKTGDEAIALTDSPDSLREKIKKAVTDSGSEIVYRPDEKPAIANLLTLYHLFSGESITALEKRYAGKGYAEFKADLAEVIVRVLGEFQKKREAFLNQPEYVGRVLVEGAEKAREAARRTLREVKQKLGLLV